MNVLLISCYELGHQPFSLASAAAHLSARGHDVRCLDLAVEDLDPDLVRRAGLVAISIPMHTAIRIGVEAGRRVRDLNPDGHLAYFGLYASLNEDHLLETTADSVIGGEFETPLADQADALAAGRGERPEGVSLVSLRDEPNMARQRFLPPVRDGLPPLERYAHLVLPDGETRRVGYVEASRGCAHRCRHCPVPAVYEGRLRIVQREVVLEDVANLVAMGAGHISFGDPDFLNGVGHSLAIAREMHRRHPDLTFDYTAKIEHLLEHPDAVEELADLGCVFVLSAVETIDDDILERLDKGHTRADVVEALRITRDAGVALRPSLLPFTPWTTPSGYVELLDFVAEHDLVYHVSPVQFSIRLLLPPGSWLLDRDDVRAHVTERVPEDFAYAWEHPEPRVDRLQEKVADAVQSASAADEDPGRTFRRIRELAHAAAPDVSAAPADEAPAASGPRPPRLSEDWFCCAEPTEDQFGAVCQG